MMMQLTRNNPSIIRSVRTISSINSRTSSDDLISLDQQSQRHRELTSRPAPTGSSRPHPNLLTVPSGATKLSVSTSTSSALGSGQTSSGSGPSQASPGLNMQAGFPARPAPQGQSRPSRTSSAAMLVERLCNACARGDLPQVNELLRAGVPLEPDKEGRSAIHYASQNGHTAAVRMLLEAGIDVDVEDNLGYTALHRAAAQGHRETVQLLIHRGSNINKQDNVHGNTALHESAWNGYAQSVGILCQARVNVNVINKANFTALHLAAQNGHNQSARVLLYAGCDANAKNNYGDTAMHTAARYGHAGVTRILISARARINETNKNGDTALHIAAALKRRKITKLLMEAGIDTSIRNKQSETVLDVARRKSHAEIVHLVLNTPSANPTFIPGHHGVWPAAPVPNTGQPLAQPLSQPLPQTMQNPNAAYQPLLAPIPGTAPVYESMLTLGGSRMHLPVNGEPNGNVVEDKTDANRVKVGTQTMPAAAAGAPNKKKGIFGGWFLRKKKDKAELADRKSDPHPQQPTTSNGVQTTAVATVPPHHPMAAHHPGFGPPTQYYRDLAGNVRQFRRIASESPLPTTEKKKKKGPVGYLSCSCLHHALPQPVYRGGLVAAPYHVPCIDHGYAEYHGPVQQPMLMGVEPNQQAGPRMVRSRSDESLSMSEHKAKVQEEKARQMALRELKAMRAAAGGGEQTATGPVMGRRAVSPTSYVPRISVADARSKVDPLPHNHFPPPHHHHPQHQSHQQPTPNRHSDILSKMESIQRDYSRPSPDGSNDLLGRSPHSTEDPSPGQHLSSPPQPQLLLPPSAAERHRAATAQLQAWYAKHGRSSALQGRAKASPAHARMSTDV